MPRTFAYFYLMSNDVARIGEAVPAHVAYWKQPAAQKYTGGTFADRSGGLITFGAEHVQNAMRVVEQDPFVTRGLISSHWLKEWLPE